MNLDELNKQLFALQNEFQQPQQNNFQKSNVNSVNFQEVNSAIETTQIKRPTKSGEHRSDINEKMNSMNTFQCLPQDLSQNPPNTMPEFTRNYSNAQKQIPKQYQTPQNPIQNHQIPMQDNHFANYYNHNFDTLQNNNLQKPINNMSFLDDNGFNNAYNSNNSNSNNSNSSNSNNNITARDSLSNATHSGGLPMLNPRNMYNMNNYEEIPNKYNESGYHKIEEKKMDYRQNMNSKLDNFIFDNPNAIEPNPILQQEKTNQNYFGQSKDTRMVIQDSNKDYYRQSANDRMSQYSPLSRASNMPIAMASMSVNDFYSNLNSGQPGQQPQSSIEPTNKDMMNSRIGSYSPLAKTIQYETQSNNGIKNPNMNNEPPRAGLNEKKISNSKLQNEPTQWNPTDINPRLKNVVFKDLPVNSNFNVNK
jgi:hypothetical protein